jgi:hypothetical protein
MTNTTGTTSKRNLRILLANERLSQKFDELVNEG